MTLLCKFLYDDFTCELGTIILFVYLIGLALDYPKSRGNKLSIFIDTLD